jgi:excisionase family DNA binding protein
VKKKEKSELEGVCACRKNSLNNLGLSNALLPTTSEHERNLVQCSLATEDVMTTAEAADFLRIPKGSLLNLSSNGKVPYYKFQRRNRYLRSDLLQLLLSTKKGAF